MLNLPVKPAKKPARRHNRYPKTGYFTDDGVRHLEQLAEHLNRSVSDTLALLVDRAYEDMIGGGAKKGGAA